jgi:hypothetical protein
MNLCYDYPLNLLNDRHLACDSDLSGNKVRNFTA